MTSINNNILHKVDENMSNKDRLWQKSVRIKEKTMAHLDAIHTELVAILGSFDEYNHCWFIVDVNTPDRFHDAEFYAQDGSDEDVEIPVTIIIEVKGIKHKGEMNLWWDIGETNCEKIRKLFNAEVHIEIRFLDYHYNTSHHRQRHPAGWPDPNRREVMITDYNQPWTGYPEHDLVGYNLHEAIRYLIEGEFGEFDGVYQFPSSLSDCLLTGVLRHRSLHQHRFQPAWKLDVEVEEKELNRIFRHRRFCENQTYDNGPKEIPPGRRISFVYGGDCTPSGWLGPTSVWGIVFDVDNSEILYHDEEVPDNVLKNLGMILNKNPEGHSIVEFTWKGPWWKDYLNKE
jgi:hypothetical protein